MFLWYLYPSLLHSIAWSFILISAAKLFFEAKARLGFRLFDSLARLLLWQDSSLKHGAGPSPDGALFFKATLSHF